MDTTLITILKHCKLTEELYQLMPSKNPLDAKVHQFMVDEYKGIDALFFELLQHYSKEYILEKSKEIFKSQKRLNELSKSLDEYVRILQSE